MTAEPTVSHRERLIRTGLRLFYENGYNGTTIDAVLAAAGVPKGSFYHHFGSKDAFGQAVLSRYTALQGSQFDKWAAKKNLSTANKLLGYFKDMAQLLIKSGFHTGCLIGKLSTEVAPTSDVFRDQLCGQLQAWKSEISALLAEGQRRGDIRTDRSSDALADAVLALIQGAFVITLSTRDKSTLTAVGSAIRELIEVPEMSSVGSRD
jgi:TetR/AcrR family transcriptional repressor of nem operon